VLTTSASHNLSIYSSRTQRSSNWLDYTSTHGKTAWQLVCTTCTQPRVPTRSSLPSKEKSILKNNWSRWKESAWFAVVKLNFQNSIVSSSTFDVGNTLADNTLFSNICYYSIFCYLIEYSAVLYKEYEYEYENNARSWQVLSTGIS